MAKTERQPLDRIGLPPAEENGPPPPAGQAPPEDDADSGRRMDPELRTMGAMLRMLAELDDAACGRVVRYLSARFPSADQR